MKHSSIILLLVPVVLGAVCLGADDPDETVMSLRTNLAALETLPSDGVPSPSDLAASLESPEAVFQFVRDEIQFEAYPGLLKGAGGTLAARSANSVDQAVLLAEIFRAKGIDTRFARRRLSGSELNGLVNGMTSTGMFQHDDKFPADPQAATAQKRFLAKLRTHTYLQCRINDQWLDCDPCFLDSAMTPARYKSMGTVPEIPGTDRHTVSLTIKCRTVVNGNTTTRPVLDHTFELQELSLKPLTLGHIIDGRESRDGLILDRVQTVLHLDRTPFPGEILGSSDGSAGGHPLSPAGRLTGIFDAADSTPPENEKESIPTGIQVTGEWVEVTLKSPGSAAESFTITVFDLEPESSGDPSHLLTTLALGFSPVRVTESTVIRAAGSSVPVMREFLDSLDTIRNQASAARAAGPGQPGDSVKLYNERFIVAREHLAWLVMLNYLRHSDDLLTTIRDQSGVAAYHDGPRAVIAALEFRDGKTVYSIDLQKNQCRFVVSSKRPSGYIPHLHFFRSLAESNMEGLTLQSFTGTPGITAGSVLHAAAGEGIKILWIESGTRRIVDTLPYDNDVKNRVRQALNRKHAVVIPERAVTLSGAAEVAWFDHDPSSGYWTGVFANGRHQGMVEDAATKYVLGCLCGDAWQYYATMQVGAVFGMAAGMNHFIDCCLANPGVECYGHAQVCAAAIRDAEALCTLYGELAGGVQLNPLPLLGVPDLMSYLAGDPCKIGARFGLMWLGCE